MGFWDIIQGLCSCGGENNVSLDRSDPSIHEHDPVDLPGMNQEFGKNKLSHTLDEEVEIAKYGEKGKKSHQIPSERLEPEIRPLPKRSHNPQPKPNTNPNEDLMERYDQIPSNQGTAFDPGTTVGGLNASNHPENRRGIPHLRAFTNTSQPSNEKLRTCNDDNYMADEDYIMR